MRSFLCLLMFVSDLGRALQTTNYDFVKDGVVELTNANFQALVLDQEKPWLAVFDLPALHCDICATLSLLVKGAVADLKANGFSVGIVDGLSRESKPLRQTYGVDGFPLMYIFGKQKNNPKRFPFSPVSSQDLVDMVVFFYKQPLSARGQCGEDSGMSPDKLTYELNDDNFETVVLKCSDPWVVIFYANRISICDEFLKVFDQAAEKLKEKAKFGKFFQLGSKVAKDHKVTHVCTVVLFPAGDKSGKPLGYNDGKIGEKWNADLIPWIQERIPK